MSKKVLIKKDQLRIDNTNRDLRYNLEKAQQYLNWWNAIQFTPNFKIIGEIKEFLTNPHFVYENAVKENLTELTGLKTLPPEIEQLKAMYQIEDCKAWSVSDNFGFEYLQIDENGILFYSDELYKNIDTENTVYATPEQALVIAELERTHNNCMLIAEIFSEGKTWTQINKDAFTQAFKIVSAGYNSKKEGNLIPWDLEKIDILINKGFASINK